MFKKVLFNIAGMHCQSCASLIELEVGKLAGVKLATADFSKKSLIAEFDEEKVDLPKIQETSKKLGYELSLV